MVVKTKKPLIKGIEPLRKEVEALRGSEEKYKTLVAASQDAIVEVDERGRIILWNKGAERIFGYSAEEILNQPVTKLMVEKHRERHRKGFESFLNENRKIRRSVEGEGLRKDGSRFPLEWSLSNWRGNGKNMVAAIGKDVSALDKAESKQKQAEELYTAFANSSQIGVYIVQDRRFQFANPKFQSRTGFSQDELLGIDPLTIVHPEDREMVRENAVKMLKRERFSPYEFRAVTKGGETRWVMETVIPIQFLGKRATLGNYMDITERKRAEEALRQSEEKYRALFDSAVIGTFIMDAETMKVVMGNQAAAKAFGFDSVEEAIGVNPLDLIPPDDREKVFKIIVKDMFEQDLREAHEFRVMAKDGRELWVSAVGTKILHQGRLAGLVSFTDITERKRAEEALQESEEKWRSLANNAPNIVMVVNRDGKIEFINRAVPPITTEAVVGKSIYDYTEPEYQYVVKEILEHVFQAGGTGSYEARWVGHGGDISWYETQVGPIKHNGWVDAVMLIMSDITERKNAEKRLKSSFINLAETVSRAIESRDPYTAGHQRRVAELAQLVGERMGLDKDRLQGLYIGGLLHDIGKVSIPASILTKPGALAEEEWALIRAHPKQGYRILEDTNLPWPVADMALHHHERLDGSGYPHGIKGDKLSLEVRILAVCDVVEAMGSYRPYRPARIRKEVLREIKSGRGTKYDASIVDVVLQIVENGEFDFAWNGRNSRSTATEVLVH